MAWNLKKDEEENIFRKRLLYDGHGSGEDKRLFSLMKNITKFCLSDDQNEDAARLFNSVSKELTAAFNSAERNEKTSTMCDKSIPMLEKAIEDKSQHIEAAKLQLKNLELELEYVGKLQKVNVYPDCSATEKLMREFEVKQSQLRQKMDKQKDNLRILIESCKELEKVLGDELDKSAESNVMIVDS